MCALKLHETTRKFFQPGFSLVSEWRAIVDEVESEINEITFTLNQEQRAEKEQEIWDAIRETHYEAIEQLPLTLHRQLSLMRQLDEQSLNYTNRLLPSLHKYIQYRQSMDNITVFQPVEEIKRQHGELLNTDLGAGTLASPMISSRSEGLHSSTLAISPSCRKPPNTNRELLSHVAWLLEELLRAAQEKVCLAQTANDSVERHIRLLDQAIKEQEAALSVSSSNSTSIHLPDLVIPSRNRNARVRTVSDAQNFSINVVDASSDIDEAEKGSRRMTKKVGKDLREISGDQTQPNSAKNCIAIVIVFLSERWSRAITIPASMNGFTLAVSVWWKFRRESGFVNIVGLTVK